MQNRSSKFSIVKFMNESLPINETTLLREFKVISLFKKIDNLMKFFTS